MRDRRSGRLTTSAAAGSHRARSTRLERRYGLAAVLLLVGACVFWWSTARDRAAATRLDEALDEPESEWSREPAPVLPAHPKTPRSKRAALKRTYEVASMLFVIGACVFWALFLRPQSLGGPAGYVLVSGESMSPLYSTGDLILVRRRQTYHAGDIVAYHVPKNDAMAGAQVIHRIIGGNSKVGFVVQGDNRTAPDVWRPKQNDIVGSAELQMPHAVVFLQLVRSPLLLGLLAASLAFVYLLSGVKRKQGPEPAPPHA
jgi:signal peptidase I